MPPQDANPTPSFGGFGFNEPVDLARGTMFRLLRDPCLYETEAQLPKDTLRSRVICNGGCLESTEPKARCLFHDRTGRLCCVA